MSMKNIDLLNETKKKEYEKVADAITSGDTEEIAAAMESWQKASIEEIKAVHAQFEKDNDEAILATRGVRMLSSEETKFWNSFIDDAKRGFKAGNVKNEELPGVFKGIMDVLPQTEFETIVDDIKSAHPLLNLIRFQHTGPVVKWILNDQPEQRASWHALNTEITKELFGGPITSLTMTFAKLTCFMFVTEDMLDLGPRWVATLVRYTLEEAMALGIEYAIVDGTGVEEPIGMTRDYTKPFDAETGYPRKTPVKVNGLTKEVYGSLLAKMAQKDNGKQRTISSVVLIVNPVDYFTKIYAATTALTLDYKYSTGIFPFPTTVVQSVAVPSGHAVMGIADDYFFGIGSAGKTGKIEYSDQFKFLEDIRTYKAKFHGNGRPKHINSFIYMDITQLEEVFPIVATTDVPKNAQLTSLNLNGIDLNIAFDRLRTDYKAETTKASSVITVTPKDGDSVVDIKVNGQKIDNGGTVNIANNAVTPVIVTVNNGESQMIYEVDITRGTV